MPCLSLTSGMQHPVSPRRSSFVGVLGVFVLLSACNLTRGRQPSQLETKMGTSCVQAESFVSLLGPFDWGFVGVSWVRKAGDRLRFYPAVWSRNGCETPRRCVPGSRIGSERLDFPAAFSRIRE